MARARALVPPVVLVLTGDLFLESLHLTGGPHGSARMGRPQLCIRATRLDCRTTWEA